MSQPQDTISQLLPPFTAEVMVWVGSLLNGLDAGEITVPLEAIEQFREHYRMLSIEATINREAGTFTVRLLPAAAPNTTAAAPPPSTLYIAR